MGLLVLVLLVWAAVTGVLWSVLEIATGVALGVFLGGMLLSVAAWWGVRRALRGRPPRGGPRSY